MLTKSSFFKAEPTLNIVGDYSDCDPGNCVAAGLSTGAAMQEQDPNGLAPDSKGAKLDAGKNRLALVLGDFPHALWEVGLVGTFGANKYTPHGWLDVENAQERYFDAAYRHLLKAHSDTCDKESGLTHLSHAVWNLLAVLELRCIDDQN